jgi:transposase InsO family protein
VKIFIRRAQKEFSLPIMKVRSDNETEFKNTQVEELLDEEGIKHEFLTLYTPQQNGVVERKNQTLIDMARTMLDEYKASDLFWCEAVNTTCHAINRLYLHKKLKKTSYELLTGNKAKVLYFRVFGCKCFILKRDPKPLNLHLKLMKAFFLVIDQMSMPIVSSIKPPVELK